MSEVKVTTNDRMTTGWLRAWRLLIAAAIFHLLVTVGIFGLGHYRVLPGTIDENGIIVFASDGIKIRAEAIQLGGLFGSGHFREWLTAPSPFHIKVYSISFALLGPILGRNILSAEPINALCYLAILVLTFTLGREVFTSRAGLLSAAIVALWPSFLLHSTQLLRDPLFVAGMLGLILVNVRLISRRLSWRLALLTAMTGGIAAVIVWLSRDTMQEVVIGTTVLAGVLILIQRSAHKSFPAKSDSDAPGWRAKAPSIVGIALLIIFTVGITRVIPRFKRPLGSDATMATQGNDSIWRNARRLKRQQLEQQPMPDRNPWSRFVARIGKLRQGFVLEFSDAGSNIDSNVQIEGTGDLVRYLPRAAMVGFLAPFPNMWLATGNQVSRGGRVLSGVEMLGMYLIEIFALTGLWSSRRRLSVWFLWLVTVMGVMSLGLVVINIGALYRLRYVFVILLIILACEGGRLTFEWLRKAKSSRKSPAETNFEVSVTTDPQ